MSVTYGLLAIDYSKQSRKRKKKDIALINIIFEFYEVGIKRQLE